MRWMGGAVLLLLLNACANIIPPDGGAKDLIAPSLLRVEPQDQSVAQRPERLVFEFDEYIQVKDPNLVRWGLFPKGRYEVKARLKRLVVVLDPDSLESDATYSLDLGGVVSDLTEGNAMGALTYAFSTGPYLDSLQMEGRLRDASTGLPVKNLMVGLYTDTIALSLPFRWTLADDSGRFVFRNLPTRRYRLVAFEDADRDKVFGMDQPKAFTDWLDPLKDTLLLLPLFAQDEDAATRLRSVDWSEEGSVALVFYGKPVPVRVRGIREDGLMVEGLQSRVSGDTLWVSSPPVGAQASLFDSATLATFDLRLVFPNREDTLLTDLKPPSEQGLLSEKTKRTLSGPSVVSWGLSARSAERRMVWDRPVHLREGYLLACWQNSKGEERAVVWKRDAEGQTPYGSGGREWFALVPGLETKNEGSVPDKVQEDWRLRLDSGAFVDGYGRQSRAFQGLLGPEGERSTLVLGFDSAGTAPDRSGDWVLRVFNANDQEVERIVYQSKDDLKGLHALEGLLPGLYKVSLLEDRNENGRWDSGRYRDGRQPEAVRWISRSIELKPGWTTELRWR